MFMGFFNMICVLLYDMLRERICKLYIFYMYIYDLFMYNKNFMNIDV